MKRIYSLMKKIIILRDEVRGGGVGVARIAIIK